MKDKKQYVSPLVAVTRMELEPLVAGAPSAQTDTGDHFDIGGDDEEGREGDAKGNTNTNAFNVWGDEE